MSVLAAQFTVIIPPPVRPDTVGGYVQWRAFGFLAILFAIWGLASASGAARGDEERGLVPAVLAAGGFEAPAVFSPAGRPPPPRPHCPPRPWSPSSSRSPHPHTN